MAVLSVSSPPGLAGCQDQRTKIADNCYHISNLVQERRTSPEQHLGGHRGGLDGHRKGRWKLSHADLGKVQRNIDIAHHHHHHHDHHLDQLIKL